jgi:hypothetical protein
LNINMPNDKSNQPPQPTTPPEAESLDEAPAPINPAPAAALAPKSAAKKTGLFKRLRSQINIFLAIFVMLILIAGVAVYVMVKPTKTDTTTPVGKLSNQQLAALKGSTTLVGDAKQTLDIQSNTILEGQVLVRSDLNVAGAIKVGSGISLPTLTVTGSGNFGQLGTSGNLSVGGDTNLQGQLTVSKNLNVTGAANFGSLSVASLNVTSLQVKSDFTFSRHIVTGGGVPDRSVGTAVGIGGTATVSGSDTAGTATINTGSSPPAGLFITINFVQHFGATPHVVITPVGSTAAGLQYYVNRDSTSFSIGTINTPPAQSSFSFDYIVID